MFANIGLSTMVIFNGGREVCDKFYRGGGVYGIAVPTPTRSLN